jgi:hypothetical protein
MSPFSRLRGLWFQLRMSLRSGLFVSFRNRSGMSDEQAKELANLYIPPTTAELEYEDKHHESIFPSRWWVKSK